MIFAGLEFGQQQLQCSGRHQSAAERTNKNEQKQRTNSVSEVLSCVADAMRRDATPAGPIDRSQRPSWPAARCPQSPPSPSYLTPSFSIPRTVLSTYPCSASLNVSTSDPMRMMASRLNLAEMSVRVSPVALSRSV